MAETKTKYVSIGRQVVEQFKEQLDAATINIHANVINRFIISFSTSKPEKNGVIRRDFHYQNDFPATRDLTTSQEHWDRLFMAYLKTKYNRHVVLVYHFKNNFGQNFSSFRLIPHYHTGEFEQELKYDTDKRISRIQKKLDRILEIPRLESEITLLKTEIGEFDRTIGSTENVSRLAELEFKGGSSEVKEYTQQKKVFTKKEQILESKQNRLKKTLQRAYKQAELEALIGFLKN